MRVRKKNQSVQLCVISEQNKCLNHLPLPKNSPSNKNTKTKHPQPTTNDDNTLYDTRVHNVRHESTTHGNTRSQLYDMRYSTLTELNTSLPPLLLFRLFFLFLFSSPALGEPAESSENHLKGSPKNHLKEWCVGLPQSAPV